MLPPGAAWHGFGSSSRFRDHRPGQADPAHAGIRPQDREYAAHGVPAPVVAQFLRENRVVPEKNDLNSLLFLLTPGVDRARPARWSRRSSPSSASTTTTRCSTTSSRNSSPAAAALPRPAPARSLRRHARASSAKPASARCRRAQFAAEHLPEMAMRRATPRTTRAQQRRLSADRRDRGPHRDHAVRRLSAGHRHHRPGRAARRARARR